MKRGAQHSIRRMAVLATGVALAGCGSAAVVMEPVPAAGTGSFAQSLAAAERGAIPLAVPISRLTVRQQARQPNAPAGPAQYELASVWIESTLRFRVAPYQDVFSQNVLAITTEKNTAVPLTVGNTFTDQTVQRITDAGQVVGAVVGLASGARPAGAAGAAAAPPPGRRDGCSDAVLPAFFIDLDRAALLDGVPRAVPGANGCFTWSLERSGPAGGADGSVSRADFRAFLEQPAARRARAFPVPSCLPVRLTVRRRGMQGEAFAATVTAADPDRLLLYPVPENGRIAMHPNCGADLTNQAVDRWATAFQALSEINTQIQAIGKAAD